MKDKTGKDLPREEIMKKIGNRVKSIFLELWLFKLHVVGLIPSHHFRRFFYRLSGFAIGKGSTIHTGARFYDIGKIKIGADSIIGEDAVLDGRDEIIIGSHVDIASEVMIYNAEHDVHSSDFAPILGKVLIEDYVFVGPRAILLPGVTIGKGAIVAAGAVVTKDVAAFDIVGGVPAKVIGQRREKDLHYKLGRARWFR